ncbi:SGNH/GDSL hydrolase family protein [Microbacterium sp. A93]|uniref:SGNH/GDSL hydrolase family protein n=1 Tax=unclassified Microbacterium TaxID=2609290 RepID=UPI003F4200D9
MTTAEASRLHDALASDAPLTWVITGDSITHGLVHTQGERSYPDHLHELIRGDLARTRDIVINSGISAHRITNILEDWDRRVAAWSPDVVTLMIGTNDCATGEARPFTTPENFTASLGEFVARVRESGGIPVLVTPPSVDAANAPERARIGEFAEAIRAVARESDTILADPYERFAALGSGGVPWRLMSDPFHPSAAGHALLALILAETLGIEPEITRTIARLEGIVSGA